MTDILLQRIIDSGLESLLSETSREDITTFLNGLVDGLPAYIELMDVADRPERLLLELAAAENAVGRGEDEIGSDHVPEFELNNYFLARVSYGGAVDIARHLAACSECREVAYRDNRPGRAADYLGALHTEAVAATQKAISTARVTPVPAQPVWVPVELIVVSRETGIELSRTPLELDLQLAAGPGSSNVPPRVSIPKSLFGYAGASIEFELDEEQGGYWISASRMNADDRSTLAVHIEFDDDTFEDIVGTDLLPSEPYLLQLSGRQVASVTFKKAE